MARRRMGPLDDRKREIWFRESEARKRGLEILRLLAYVEPENGFTDEQNEKTKKEMFAELEDVAKQFRSCQTDRGILERHEREALEATKTTAKR